MTQQARRESQRRPILVIGVLALSLFALILLSFGLGRYPVPPGDLFQAVMGKLFPSRESLLDPNTMTVIWSIRMPRILAACLVGGCLSAAGAAYQGVFQNPMASPDILGSSSGAAFGAALAILFHVSRRMVSIWAFAFSLLSVLLVYGISRRARGKQVLTLILSGIMVSSLFSAGTSFIKLVADPTNQLPAITYWMMGSLSGMSMKDVSVAFLPMLVGSLLLLLLRWRLNLLTLGDEQAQTMGVSVRSIRMVVILAATLVTAASISISGMVGWVGLVIPHLSRRLVGNDYRYLMPVSMLFGAVFLLGVDNLSRNLLATEIPLGILTAFLGAPIFFYLLIRGEGVV